MKKSLKQMVTFATIAALSVGGLTVYAQEESTETESSATAEVLEDSQDEEATESGEESSETSEEAETIEHSIEMINNDEEVIGTADFTQDAEGLVTLHIQLENLEPGEYGFHIHEVGLATAPDFEDAGSHFNPTDVEHGAQSETGPHLGDLPNLVVGEDGTVDETIEIEGVTLEADAENSLQSIDGTTLIIHTGADDYTSQPTGDAGDRQAAGVIFAPQEDSEYFEADDAESGEESTEEESSEAETSDNSADAEAGTEEEATEESTEDSEESAE